MVARGAVELIMCYVPCYVTCPWAVYAPEVCEELAKCLDVFVFFALVFAALMRDSAFSKCVVSN